ncbi:MAG TPA: hypothetical protein VFF06_18240 [Polyangia bacterium]|nr:hypothetical protein [Polyangia bacterium]
MRWIALASTILLAGCVVESRVFCTDNTQCPKVAPFCDLTVNACQSAAVLVDGGADATPTNCTTSAMCGPAKPICDGGMCRACVPVTDDGFCLNRNPATPFCAPNGQCEQCAKSSQCTQAGKTFCDGTTYQCRPCLNADCPSGVCNKGTNVCVPGTNVYTVDATLCPSPSSPMFCTLQAAVTAAAGDSTIKDIVIKGNSSAYLQNISIMNDITIIGPYADAPPSKSPSIMPATIQSSQNGIAVIQVGGTAHVTLDGVVVSGGTQTGGFGISCFGAHLDIFRSVVTSNFDTGVVANSPCTLTIDQSIIGSTSGSVGNGGGGIKIVDTSSTIQNSFIVGNGNMNANIQAVTYSFSAVPPAETFYNNTVADNNGKGGTAGIQCLGVSGGTMIGFYNTIFWQNYANPVAGKVLAETSGFCLDHYSATDDAAAFISGDHIVKLGGANPPPGFVAAGDYHIQANSACVAQGTTVSAPLYDIDGDARGPANDIGADQH